MGIAEIQHIAHIPGVAVLQGQDAVGGTALFHRREHLTPAGAGQGPAPGEQMHQGDMGKGPFHPLVGHGIPPQHGGLVLTGKGHFRLEEILKIGFELLPAQPGGVLFDHLLFPAAVQDGHSMLPFIADDLGHRLHPSLKKLGHFGIHIVNHLPGLFQLIHPCSSPLFFSLAPG